MNKITVGGGCFWCLEAVFQRVEGVSEVRSGYAGGETENPTYREVCEGSTGHAEVVQITFDPEVRSIEEILEIFFEIHDPTTLNRQGADVGTQYRSIILAHDEEQLQAAHEFVSALRKSGRYADPIVTEITTLEEFHPAENYHHDYFNQNRQQPYCTAVVAPKVRKMLSAFPDRARTDDV